MKQRGFTLLEMMIVLVIITVVMSFTWPTMVKQLDKQAARLTAEQINMLIVALQNRHVKYLNQGQSRWDTLEECRSPRQGFGNDDIDLSSNVSLFNKFGFPFTMMNFSRTATMQTITTTVKKQVREYVLSNLPFGNPDPNSETGIIIPVQNPASEPGWRSKISNYAGAPAEERTMAESLILPSLTDSNNPNYYLDADGVSHLHKVIIDELVCSSPVIDPGTSTIEVDNISTHTLRFDSGVGENLTIGDLDLDSLTVNKLRVLQSADIRIGGWGIHDGGMNNIMFNSGHLDAGAITVDNLHEYGSQPLWKIGCYALRYDTGN